MKNDTGVYQLSNGNWGFRYALNMGGKKVWKRSSVDEEGNALRTKAAAKRARLRSINAAKTKEYKTENKPSRRAKVKDIWEEYCNSGRSGKAHSTILKQDSLWKQHIEKEFGDRYIDNISVADINDYLSRLYYEDGLSYRYVESFLKMFYLIYGQGYNRGMVDRDVYEKFCSNKISKIHMPKMKINEDIDIVIFSNEQLCILDQYFSGTNAETAYLLGRYCGLRISECYGLKWDNVDFDNGIINIDRQMICKDGIYELCSLKTRKAKRIIYMSDALIMRLNDSYRANIDISGSDLYKQNGSLIKDIDGTWIPSYEMVNCLPDGTIQTVNSMKYHSKLLKQKYGIYFKYHYLRHTYASILANLNTPSAVLMNQLGHANINVTMKYYISDSEQGIQILKDNINTF